MTHLLADERPITTARQHWLVVVPSAAANVILLIFGLVALNFVPQLAKGSLGDTISPWLNLVRLALLVFVAVSVVYRYLQWRNKTYLLTNQRIIVSRGVVSRLVTSVALDRVQDTIVHQDFMARLVRCGDVEIESAGRDGTEVMRLIPDPQGFCNALLEAIEAHRTGRPYPFEGTAGGVEAGVSPNRAPWDSAPPWENQRGGDLGYGRQPGYPQPDYRTVPAYGRPDAGPGGGLPDAAPGEQDPRRPGYGGPGALPPGRPRGPGGR